MDCEGGEVVEEEVEFFSEEAGVVGKSVGGLGEEGVVDLVGVFLGVEGVEVKVIGGVVREVGHEGLVVGLRGDEERGVEVIAGRRG